MEHFVQPPGMPPVVGFSHAVAFSGRMLAVSGQVPLDADGTLVGDGDPRAQARQVFTNLGTALAAAGASMANVVKLNFYLTDLDDLPVVREVRDGFLPGPNPPASTAVGVRALVDPAFRIEIDALAEI